MKKLLDQAMLLKKEQPLFFFLTATKYAVSFLFFISLLIPFYSASGLGITVRFTLFNMNAWFIYFIIFLGIGIAYLFLVLTNKRGLANKIFLVNFILAVLLILLFLLALASDKSQTPSYVTFSIGLGFFLDLIFIAAMAILQFKPSIAEKVLVKLFKINPVVAETVEVPAEPVVEPVVEELPKEEPAPAVEPEKAPEVEEPVPAVELEKAPEVEVATEPEPEAEVATEPEPEAEVAVEETPEEKKTE
ncbi:MAG: hypothetical protein KKE16_07015 [Firmicutes bacterium]|nr:hypothetical protein [Bacillota bacterium]